MLRSRVIVPFFSLSFLWLLAATACGDGAGGACAEGGCGVGAGAGPGAVSVASFVVEDDSDGDGVLSPGETGSVVLFARNRGGEALEGVRASASVSDPGVAVVRCRASRRSGSSSTWSCDQDERTCDCAESDYTQDLAPGESGPAPLLAVGVTVSADAATAPFSLTVTFRDAAGHAWTEVVSVPIAHTGGLLQPATAEVRDDSDGSGALNPGESAWIDVFVRNGGGVRVLGARASATTHSPSLAVDACKTWRRSGASSSWSCDLVGATGCDCAEGDYTQDLEPGETSPAPLLGVHVVLSPDALAAPVSFDLTLADALGNTWPATVQVPVSPGGASVIVASSRIENDTNGDGALSPGEAARLLVSARNRGASAALAVRASATVASGRVAVTGCRAYRRSGSSASWTCDVVDQMGCDCDGSDYTQDLDAGETSPAPLLGVDLLVDPGAGYDALSLGVRFDDALGNTWRDTVIVPVVPSGASLALADVVVSGDGDSGLSPGESGRVVLHVRNAGTSRALGVRAAATLDAGAATVTGCRALRASGSGSSFGCARSDAGCDCSGSDYTQDLEPGETSPVPLVEISLSVAQDATSPLEFSVVLADALGQEWVEPLSVALDAPAARPD